MLSKRQQQQARDQDAIEFWLARWFAISGETRETLIAEILRRQNYPGGALGLDADVALRVMCCTALAEQERLRIIRAMQTVAIRTVTAAQAPQGELPL
jgi:hypothetical protein